MSELRDLLDRQARRIQGGDHALGSVMRRVQRRRRTRRVATGTLALMIAAVGTFGAYRAFRPSPVERGLSQAGTHEVFEGIWPETGFDELEEAQRAIDEGHQPWRTDPVETARAFATNVMQWKYDEVQAEIPGSDDPTAVLVELSNRDSPTVQVDVSTFVTLKQLGRQGDQGIWSVVGAEGGLLHVSGTTGPGTTPQSGAHLLIVGDISHGTKGTSIEVGVFAGEGGIPFDSEGSLSVRRIDVSDGPHFGADLGPLPDDPDGSVILMALARDPTGSIVGAAARRVPIAALGSSSEVVVFFSADPNDPQSLAAVARSVPVGTDPLETALRELVRGPTAEERAQGLASPFSDETAEFLNFATVEDGLATVDFGDLSSIIPGTSAVALALEVQLSATVFQFPQVNLVRYQINGSCEAFSAFVNGLDICPTISEGLPRGPSPEPLLAAVAETRDAILEAAADRDYETLSRLGEQDNLTFSYGGESDPVRFWKDLEAAGKDPLGTLTKLLVGSPTIRGDSGIYIWPSIFDADPSWLNIAELQVARQIASEEEIQTWRDAGQYLGYRVGITPDGRWLFFVAGD